MFLFFSSSSSFADSIYLSSFYSVRFHCLLKCFLAIVYFDLMCDCYCMLKFRSILMWEGFELIWNSTLIWIGSILFLFWTDFYVNWINLESYIGIRKVFSSGILFVHL
jgi:hypothetical protein